MVRYKNVNGIKTLMTANEELAIQTYQEEQAAKEASYILNDKWRDDRRKAYKSVEDYLDMIWHIIDQGLPLDQTSEFYLDRKAVKDTLPKPGP